MIFLDSSALEAQRLLPPWLVAVSGQISYFGKSGWVLWPLGIAFVATAALVRPGLGKFAHFVCLSIAVRLEFLFFAIAIPGLADSGIKRLIGRARPSAVGPFEFVPFSLSNGHASLPSGHATSAAAIAIAFGALFPTARIPLWLWAGAVGLSRIAVRAHYPSDVLAGMVFGAIGAILIRNWFAARRLAFTIKPDGSVLPLPGCSRQRLRRLVLALLSR
jgi:membrane-associated phospholipid phosphatase